MAIMPVKVYYLHYYTYVLFHKCQSKNYVHNKIFRRYNSS